MCLSGLTRKPDVSDKMFRGRPGAYSLEDGALHLQFRGRAFGATGRGATGRAEPYRKLLLAALTKSN